MARLVIRNFSCIDEAELKLAPLTILIGPQASGKSVISKLVYFFYDAVLNIFGDELELPDRTFEQFCSAILEDFKKSFPPQAWGQSSFVLEFIAGPAEIRIARSKPRKGSVGAPRVHLSDFLREIYAGMIDDISAARDSVEQSKKNTIFPGNLEIFWKVREKTRLKLRAALSDDFVSAQLFIPAGRSFFTSMGKAVVAFEHGGFLDPVTVNFGRYFLILRDHFRRGGFIYRSPRNEKSNREFQNLRERLSEQLFSGEIKIEKDEGFIEAIDGRKIPFPFISSGQQELLPLWITLNEFLDGESPDFSVYIEEPEAHLFPLAQGVLTEYFSTLLTTSPRQKMLITTHSPYMLAKMNNLLKAGSLAAKSTKRMQNEIDAIIPRLAWLTPGTTTAYAIINKKVVAIIGDDGLIDGEYLDGISSEIAREFDQLLEIEYMK